MGELDAQSGCHLPAEFGNYSIVNHLATGGMAEVYVARQTGIAGFERLVVIKRVRQDLIGDRDMIRLLLDEARLVATLQHPNIAQVYEIGRVDEAYFIAMEYLPGADLRRLLRRAEPRGQRFAAADAIYIAIQICIALHYAHDKRGADGQPLGIVHRDVTPSNVLIGHDGTVKICDFGIAKASNRTIHTANGMLKGKFGYMSPEQCRCGPIDRRSDVFSLGILLYEISTLTRPYADAKEFELLRMIVAGPPPPPSTRVAGYPPGLERIVMRALATDPAARYPTAQAMQLELEELARAERLAVSSVNVARLMAELLGTGAEPAVDEAPPPPSARTRLGLGTGPSALGLVPPRPATSSVADDAARSLPATRLRSYPPSALWLAGAMVAGFAALGVTLAGRALDRGSATAAAVVLAGDAERLAGAIEVAHRLARARAAEIAAMPIVRAAIETDAATVRDIAERDAVFSIGPGEALEIFQLRDDAMTSLLHLPADSPALAPLIHSAPRVTMTARTLVVVAGAAVDPAGAPAVAGEIAVAAPVDVAAATQLLAHHVRAAWLRGPGLEINLVGTGGPPALVTITRLPITSGLGAADQAPKLDLALVAVPDLAARGWVARLRLASIALGALALAWYAWRRGRAPQPAAVTTGPTTPGSTAT